MNKISNKSTAYPLDIKVMEISGPPFNTEPIASPNYVISICHKGVFEANYDFEHVVFKANEIAVVYPNHILVPTNVSSDYQATIIDVPSQVFYSMLKHFIDSDHFRFESKPCFALTAEQHNNLMRIVDALRTIDTINFNTSYEMKHSITEIIIEIIHYYHSMVHPEKESSSKEILSKRFFQAVIDHCTEHHDVTFYANHFHLSPKYFSSAIAHETGHNAQHWIQFYLAAKSKQILYMQSDAPLNIISYQLGFNELSSFSRFFKHIVGMSPSEWRNKICSAKK